MKKNLIILCSSFIFLVIFGFFALKLEFISNMEDMLPSDSNSLKASQDFNQYFESQDQVILIIENKGSDLADFKLNAVSFMEDFENNIKNESYIDNIYYSFDMSSLEAFEWAYIDIEYYRQIDQFIDLNDITMVNQILTNLMASKDSQEAIEYLVSDNGNYFILIISPSLDQTNFMESREQFYSGVMEQIELSLETTNTSNLEVGLTGGAFIQDLESDAVALEGLFGTMIITAVLILIVLIVFLGSLKLPLLSLYPLFLGAIIASGVAYIIYGSINVFAVSFALLLLGLGIDFAVHLIVRYQEEKQEKEKSEAVKIAFKSTGISIAIGGITTGFAFAAFTFAKFKAFEQMGIISAIGIICLLIVMLLLIPVIISLFDADNITKTLFTSIIGIKTIVEKMAIHPKTVFAIVISLIFVFSFSVRNFELKTSIDAIYPDNIPSLEWVEIIENEFDYSTSTISTYANNIDELLVIQESLLQRDDISSVDSILNYYPSDMSEKTQLINKLNDFLLSYDIDLFANYNLREMSISDFPTEIKDTFVGTNGKLRVDIVSNINIYDLDQYNELSEGISSVTGKKPIGIPAMMNEISSIVEGDILRISILCLFCVFMLSLLLFRSIKNAIVTMIPLLLTLYFTIALLPLLNVEVNIFSIAAFPLIIGISIDSVIHLLHRLKENDGNTASKKTARTGKAILLTTVTTVIGFGSLSQINHPGMANLGLTVVVGMIVSFFFTILLTPLLFTKILQSQTLDE